MRQQEVFNKIGGIIRELNDQYAYMQSAGDLFNDLELELMAANAHFLSDHVEILRKISRNNEKAQPVNDMPTDIKDKLAPELSFKREQENIPETTREGKVEPQSQPSNKGSILESYEVSPAGKDIDGANDTDRVFEFDTKPTNPNEVNIIYEMEPEIIRHELIMDDTSEDWDEDDNEGEADLKPGPFDSIDTETETVTPEPELVTPEPEVIKPEPKIVELKPEPVPVPEATPAVHKQIIVEDQQVLTLNERMSAQLASRKADQLAPQPITDLKSAINLNDKLIFIKDLFHGYSLAYSEALDILNRMHTFDEADKFLKSSYAVKNNWADKQATADKFYALLQRRYI